MAIFSAGRVVNGSRVALTLREVLSVLEVDFCRVVLTFQGLPAVRVVDGSRVVLTLRGFPAVCVVIDSRVVLTFQDFSTCCVADGSRVVLSFRGMHVVEELLELCAIDEPGCTTSGPENACDVNINDSSKHCEQIRIFTLRV